jgi:proteasome lid subunit RPN8/RPN11
MGLVSELKKRGGGRRESGAFLLAKKSDSNNHVETFICYDDLDPNALSSGIVMFHATGLSALWKLCSQKGLRVLADVHTHPTIDVRQSRVDRENPMIPVQGHVALILPNYGNTSLWSLNGVGLHVFQGQVRWQSFDPKHPDSPVTLCIW